MAEESIEIQGNPEGSADLIKKLEGFAEKTVKIPGIGEIGVMELPKYVPLYISITKTKAIRDLIPREIHSAIMEFAYATGIEEKPQTKTKLADIPLPRGAIIQTILNMHDQGWGNAQIAKQLNMNVKTITDLITEGKEDRGKGKWKITRRINKWLTRKAEERIEAMFLNAEKLEKLLPQDQNEDQTAEETKH